jgi:ADP-ribose pyrophosphatase YjhB (NUDIX family)
MSKGAGKHFHPYLDEHGKPIAIDHPSTATDIVCAGDADSIVTFVPGSPVPASLNGIAFASWVVAPSTQEGWSKVAGQVAMDEPALILNGWKKAATGVVIEEADGRIWLASPTNAFGGYQQTFPKGKAEAGLSLQAVAIKECFEDSGLQVQITGIVGDFERSTSFCCYYAARRVGGSPADFGWESQAVHLVPKSRLRAMLNTSDDRKIASVLGISSDS